MKKLLIALLFVAGCAKRSSPGPEDPSKEMEPPSAAGTSAEKPAEPPAADDASGMKEHPSPEGVIKFSVPAAWKRQEPSNNMRKAQYGIPDKEGKAKDAGLALFFFGPSRTRMEAIIDRWRGQVSGSSGDPEVFEGRHKVTLLDLSGNYAGDFGGEPIPDARMLAAVVDTEAGPWYFKLTGPAATVGDWREEFIKVLKAAHK